MSTGPHDRSARQAKIDAAGPKPSKAKPILVAAVVLVTVAALAVAVWLGNRPGDEPTARPTGTAAAGDYPQGATGPSGGIVVEAANAGADLPTLDIYEDFQCPGCQSMERSLGPTIKEMAESGQIRVVYHMKTFLDRNLKNDASMRAGNGAACAADAGHFQGFHDQVYANAPTSEGQGWTNEQLAQFASSAGMTGDTLATWQQCFDNGTYNGYLQQVEETTAQDGVESTPTLRLNGENLDLRQIASIEDFRAKLLAAGGQ